jgi:2-(1,2-epoxy-1,2-dihydrophenyl)acetyl-CoA isomerase
MAYSRVGLTPDGSSSWYLPRLIGLRRALQLAMLNSELTADQALEWGLLNEVVADDLLDEALARIVVQLAAGPTAALGGAKRLMRGSLENGLETQLTLEMQAICTSLEGGDAKEGMAAFLGKRAPYFGR